MTGPKRDERLQSFMVEAMRTHAIAKTISRNTRKGLIGRVSVLLCLLILVAGAAPPSLPSPSPVTRWNASQAGDLIAYVETIDRGHGLDPNDYGIDEVRSALKSGDLGKLDAAATLSFSLVARDLTTGHVRPAQRRLAHFAFRELPPAMALRFLDSALIRNDVAGTLESLAPSNSEYRALRAALPQADVGRRDAIKVNLERWRWLPRTRPPRLIMVNIPEFRARLIEGLIVVADHRVIVGKPATPTLQFSTAVTAVIFNPPWHVPQSIVAESVGRLVRTSPVEARRRGYTWSSADGRLRVTQQPGPGNALGQMKLDMPNPYSIFLHDTPNKALFEQTARTFSHGCIRTDRPFELAEVLLGSEKWSSAAIAGTVARKQTTKAVLAEPVPVQVVYFTAVPGEGGAIQYLDDPYGLDSILASQLKDRQGH